MKVTINKNTLVLEVPINATPVASKTGKSKIVASSGGFVVTGVSVEGKPVKINLTAII